jgi:hypothetical protein
MFILCLDYRIAVKDAVFPLYYLLSAVYCSHVDLRMTEVGSALPPSPELFGF